jgi:hypothetical protein
MAAVAYGFLRRRGSSAQTSYRSRPGRGRCSPRGHTVVRWKFSSRSAGDRRRGAGDPRKKTEEIRRLGAPQLQLGLPVGEEDDGEAGRHRGRVRGRRWPRQSRGAAATASVVDGSGERRGGRSGEWRGRARGVGEGVLIPSPVGGWPRCRRSAGRCRRGHARADTATEKDDGQVSWAAGLGQCTVHLVQSGLAFFFLLFSVFLFLFCFGISQATNALL